MLRPADSGGGRYARNGKKHLYRFLDDPAIAPDNNRAENAIRPFVVGRKNRLFSDSEKGADASTLFYYLAATATANGLNVEKYLTELFTAQDTRMPWNDAEQSCLRKAACSGGFFLTAGTREDEAATPPPIVV